MVVGSFNSDSDDSNYCLRIDNRSQQAAQDGDLSLNSVIFACADATKGDSLPNGTSVEDWAATNGAVFATIDDWADPTPNAHTDLQLLEDSPPVYSIEYATMSVDGKTPGGAPQNGVYIGALSTVDVNWAMGWTYGIFDGDRGRALWFE